jgi:integrase/recombinase XerC
MSLPAVIPAAPQPPAVPEITDQELLELWLAPLGHHTRRAYGRDLLHFAKHCGVDTPGEAIRLLIAVGPAGANRRATTWRAAMEAGGLRSATVARRISALRSALAGAASYAAITWQLTVRSPRVEPYRDVRGPGRKGWRSMVAGLTVRAADPAARTRAVALRDLAVVRLLHDLMLRRAEAAGLDLEHIEFEAEKPAACWIRGKGRSERERLELPIPTAAALAAWLGVRGVGPGPLFIPLDRERDGLRRLSDKSIAKIVNKAGIRAGLDRPARPHGLRHEAITRAIEMDVGLLEVQGAARHKDPRTTQRYIDRVRNPQPKVSRIIAEDI